MSACTRFVCGASEPVVVGRSLTRTLMLLQPWHPRRNFSIQNNTSSSNTETEAKQYRDRILEASLRKVPQLGWSDEAIGEATREQGLPIALKGLVHGGPSELIFYFLNKCNQQMATIMRKEKKEGKLEGLSVKEVIAKCIRTRLELSSAYVASLPQAVKILSHPSNVSTSLNVLAELSDEICHLTNDRSTNFDWYAKRVVIGGIYSATEVFMLTDKSPNYAETWRFLDRRIEDAIQLAELKDKAETIVGLAATGLFGLFRIAKDTVITTHQTTTSPPTFSTSSSSSSTPTNPSTNHVPASTSSTATTTTTTPSSSSSSSSST
eukprot:TRINITY_DN3719_c0_g3_i1.p1 TRINITY_DN3719_c0_g3~~TRINITY_DN3719_c0_g3_i1.p1  ORF type:complete len:364 (+),score=86.11 TRINITY_DN3719_c0_g3_i1:127-1092(+)